MLKDKYILNKNSDFSYTKCYACNLKSHSIEFCPRLLFLPDKLFIIQRHIYSEPTLSRNLHNRKTKHSPNARANLITITQSTNYIISNLDQNVIDESINDSDDIDSQKSCSLSLILEEEFQDNLHNHVYHEKKAGNLGGKKNEDLKSYWKDDFNVSSANTILKSLGNKVEDLLGTRKNEGEVIFDIKNQNNNGGEEQGTSGKEENLPFEGSMNNINRNPRLPPHRNPRKRKSRSEDTWKGGDSLTKRSRNREMMNGEEVLCRRGSILNGISRKRGSEVSWSPEGVEMGNNLNILDSKRYSSFKAATLIREDLMFRYIQMFLKNKKKIILFFL